MADAVANRSSLTLQAVLCIGPGAFDRFGRVLRHLVVGLVDQAVHLRLLSPDPRVESLSLGPTQTVLHGSVGWPATNRRARELVDALSHQPPTTVHALSVESYRMASAIAEAFDADLVAGVTSLADCAGVAELGPTRFGRLLAPGESLAAALKTQANVQADRVVVVRPGIRASETSACFADADRAATVLCTAPLARGSGVDRLLEAIRILGERGHRLLLFLLGQGRHEPTLRRLVRDQKLSACVTFAHPLGDLTHAMRASDIFVRPSEDTTVAVDDLQAMGAGMVVVTPASSVNDHLRDGETALLCAEPTAASLAGVIERLVVDRNYARRIADAGREYVRSHHAISEMAQRTAGAYRELALARATFPIKE